MIVRPWEADGASTMHHPEPTTHHQFPGTKALVPLLAVAGLVSLISTRICDAMLPALALSFGINTLDAAAVVSSYAIAYGVMQLVYGPLGDRFGKLRIITIACAMCTCAAIAAAAASSFGGLVLARAAMGATAAAILPLAVAAVSDMAPPEQRQQMLARVAGVTVMGLALGPMVGGWVTQWSNWRVPFVMVAVLLGTIACLVGRRMHSHGTTTVRAPGGIHRMLVRPWSWTILGAACVEAAMGIGCLAVVPTVLHQRFGLSLGLASTCAGAFGAGGFLFSRCAGLLLRKVPRTQLPAIGGTIVTTSFAMLAVMPQWQWAFVACCVMGFGFYTLHNTLQVEATQLAPGSSGSAVSIFTAAIFVGQSAGVSLAAFGVANLGPGWVFAAAAVGFLALGAAITLLLQRRLSAPLDR
ncbi:MAG: MFS transporter [Rhodoferax sp.]|nr:MFS transporter [Rhodoferax sp.]